MNVRKPNHRAGVAAMEFVLVFPFLCLFTVIGWYVAHAGFVKLATEFDVRRQTWEQRLTADGGEPFDIHQSPLVSLVSATIRRAVPFNPPFASSAKTAVSDGFMTDKTWDALEFPFPLLPDGIKAHTEQVEKFAQFEPSIVAHAPAVSGFSAMNPWTNPVLSKRIPEGLAFIPRRTAAVATIAGSSAALGAAEAVLIREAVRNAITNPPLAAHYAREAEVVFHALISIPRILSAARMDR